MAAGLKHRACGTYAAPGRRIGSVPSCPFFFTPDWTDPMHALPVTSVYAALCGLLLLVLSARVVFLRRSARIGIGTGDHPELTRRIRVHGNAIETMPMVLILLLLAEASGSPAWLLHACGAGFVLRIGNPKPPFVHGAAQCTPRAHAVKRPARMPRGPLLLSSGARRRSRSLRPRARPVGGCLPGALAISRASGDVDAMLNSQQCRWAYQTRSWFWFS